MIELLVITSTLILVGLPTMLVLCACIAGTRAEREIRPAKLAEKLPSQACLLDVTIESQ